MAEKEIGKERKEDLFLENEDEEEDTDIEDNKTRSSISGTDEEEEAEGGSRDSFAPSTFSSQQWPQSFR